MKPWRMMGAAAGACVLMPLAAEARPAFVCNGFAMMGGAQLLCSHVDPGAPPQVCTFSWSLMGTSGQAAAVAGAFLLIPGQTNATAYQGSGFSYELSSPIVLCQGRRHDP